ncbi:hypothetical protein EDC94DRAFT_580085 [Helicostylum pulchrum]|uniref:MARVEL domain-containing protein n=1 Tax=Helicostylum pulchrum TaxID=562976 RepID=A0ABP9XUH3_9FUNG|nr:hypothetical protein EDC94DRAFT_580085 [Helicostylum pulchrum]
MNNSWDTEDIGEKTQVTPTLEHNNNAWESNKQELPPIDQPLHAAGTSIDIPSPPPVVEEEKPHRHPSLPRILIRVWQFFAAIGAFGFQVGASPYSGEEMPFSKPDLMYYGYVICWLSITWSSFNVFVYLTRRFGNGHKIKRFVSTLIDAALTALFGVCVFYQIATYKCKPGLHNGWCDFYNTGIFFLMSLFLTYVIHALWDVFGAMTCLRR